MKLRYNLLAKLSLLCALAFVMVQCNEDESSLETGGDIELLDSLPTGTYGYEVTDIVVTPEERALSVTWKAPEDAEGLSHYIVEWQGESTDTTLYSTPVNETSYKITHLYNDSYIVRVRSVGKNMLKSIGVTSATSVAPVPDNDGPVTVQNLQINALATSAIFIWNNPADEDFFKTIVEIYDLNGDSVFLQDTLQSIDSELAVYNMTESGHYRYTFTTYDYIGNASTPLTDEFNTLTEKKVTNKPDWTIIDYSSCQTSESIGVIEAVIDGKDDTYWHSQWSPSLPLPQHVTIDLKEPIILSAMEVFRRKGNGNGATQIRLDGKLNPKDEWTDLGTSPVDASTDGGQKVPAKLIMQVRYVKVTVVASKNGYAMVREIDAWELN